MINLTTERLVDEARYVGAPKVAGADNHAFEPRRDLGQDADILLRNCWFDASGASEAGKLPNCWRVRVVGGESTAGVEDNWDINRGGDITFDSHRFIGLGRQHVTCKGGARRVMFLGCPGLEAIVLGDYSKYDAWAVYPDGQRRELGLFRPLPRPPVRDVVIVPARGAMLPEVSCWHARKPLGGRSSGLRWPGIVTYLYFYARGRWFKETMPAPAEFHALAPDEV